jgi:hypothetical protein
MGTALFFGIEENPKKSNRPLYVPSSHGACFLISGSLDYHYKYLMSKISESRYENK